MAENFNGLKSFQISVYPSNVHIEKKSSKIIYNDENGIKKSFIDITLKKI